MKIVLFIENIIEFIEKYLKAKMFVKMNTLSQPILSTPGLNRIAVGNWILISKKESELSIQNSDGLQVSNKWFIYFIIQNNAVYYNFIANNNINKWIKWLCIPIKSR